MTMAKATNTFTIVLIAGLSIAVIAPIVLSEAAWPTLARDMIDATGFNDTGARNLVSSIYLGYRAYDTLGETIVLLAALAGSAAIIAGEHPRRGSIQSSTAEHRSVHTEILNVIAGKLAPIVLLFGTYVMLYGHVSPGGGFQGGVVLASGIIFIALGRRSGGIGRIDPGLSVFGHHSLLRMEAYAFTTIVLLTFPGSARALEAIRTIADSIGLHIPAVSYIIALNITIGLKVGSGVALLCVLMLGGETE
ncbi:MAG: MnhB domain-containing protein [Spirochaetia bacterium]|jgi:multicomponent Na+:H+ antiporter subunit B|nr:MnhB domain-containing protein [Spirochaetia bacterium]